MHIIPSRPTIVYLLTRNASRSHEETSKTAAQKKPRGVPMASDVDNEVAHQSSAACSALESTSGTSSCGAPAVAIPSRSQELTPQPFRRGSTPIGGGMGKPFSGTIVCVGRGAMTRSAGSAGLTGANGGDDGGRMAVMPGGVPGIASSASLSAMASSSSSSSAATAMSAKSMAALAAMEVARVTLPFPTAPSCRWRKTRPAALALVTGAASAFLGGAESGGRLRRLCSLSAARHERREPSNSSISWKRPQRWQKRLTTTPPSVAWKEIEGCLLWCSHTW
mmetsp:Transcript_7105/g.21451  ORF Transcript_7105/g.21451 Transcript_7105/m.21451 type:complete len:279 (+) Transcript_7105:1228-2064(+)